MHSAAADARLDAAVKTDDGFFATHFVSPYSRFIARWAARRGITPNSATTAALVVGLAAAAAFGVGTRASLIVGAVLLQASFTLDCVDGQLARYTGRLSRFGGWYDALCDRVKEFAVYAGLAIASTRGFDHAVWGLALAALILQCARQLAGLGYEGAVDGARQPGGGVARLSARSDASPWTRWPKRIVVLPIGERFLLISVTAAATRPQITFVALLVWGGVAAAYSLSGRVLRSLA